MNRPALLLVAFTLSWAGCAKNIIRTEYGLNHYEDIVATDSQTRGDPKRLTDQKVQIRQSVVIENLSRQKDYLIELNKAEFVVNESAFPSSCKEFKRDSATIVLRPRQKVRVECLTDLESTQKNQLANKDSSGFLTLPYGSSGRKMQFRYFIKVEDFE